MDLSGNFYRPDHIELPDILKLSLIQPDFPARPFRPGSTKDPLIPIGDDAPEVPWQEVVLFFFFSCNVFNYLFTMNLAGKIVIGILLSVFSVANTGCAAYFANKYFQKMKNDIMSKPVDLEVYQPELLSRIKRMAVLDFRVIEMSGQEGIVDIYKDTYGEGQCWFPRPMAGVLLAECFEEQLLQEHDFEVVERNQLTAVLKEKNLEMSGLVDGQNSGALTGLQGVDAIVLGTLANGMFYMPNNPGMPQFFTCGIRLRVIDVKTGKIILTLRDKIFESGWVDEEDILYLAAQRSVNALHLAMTNKNGR